MDNLIHVNFKFIISNGFSTLQDKIADILHIMLLKVAKLTTLFTWYFQAIRLCFLVMLVYVYSSVERFVGVLFFLLIAWFIQARRDRNGRVRDEREVAQAVNDVRQQPQVNFGVYRFFSFLRLVGIAFCFLPNPCYPSHHLKKSAIGGGTRK